MTELRLPPPLVQRKVLQYDATKSANRNGQAFRTPSSGPRSPGPVRGRKSSMASIPGSDESSDSEMGSPKSPSGFQPVDWVGNHNHGIRRRSFAEAPPVGSPSHAWGKYDTPEEILNRPKPPVAGHGASMGKHGGRWSYYQPVNEIYLISKKSLQAPGPGSYGYLGAPDPDLSNRPSAFSKKSGGKFSKYKPLTDVEIKMKTAAAVPGPGAYDTEHLYGIYKQIEAGNPMKSRHGSREVSRQNSREVSRQASRENSRPGSRSGPASPTNDPAKELMVSVWPETSEILLKTWGDRPVDFVTMEQALVMSRRVPLTKFNRLSTTRYSRLRKDVLRNPVRKYPARSASAMSTSTPSDLRDTFGEGERVNFHRDVQTPNDDAPTFDSDSEQP